MGVASFIGKHEGSYVTAPGGIGGQCVDLANMALIEIYNLPPVRANAIDWQRAAIPGFKWIANTPNNYPTAGALVVWGPWPGLGIGDYGHIALAVSADPLTLVTFDQNWPPNEPCQMVIHGYGGVLGWHVKS